jgi:RNA ligase
MSHVLLREILDVSSLEELVKTGLVRMRPHESAGLFILDYSAQAQYARNWTPEISTSRGLIISGPLSDPKTYVVARPFAKFGNVGEHGPNQPFAELPLRLPFEATEKMDGSLAIAYFDGEKIALSTRGSFHSDQAKAASALWARRFGDVVVPENVTLLFEYIAPWNRVIVAYEQEDLVFLAALDNRTGADVEFTQWPGKRVRVFSGTDDFTELVDIARSDPNPTDEGFVVRFVPEDVTQPSVRVKLKFSEYLRVHRLMSKISSVTIWEHLSEGKPLDEMLDGVPDEFYEFIQDTVSELTGAYEALLAASAAVRDQVRGLDRKVAAEIISKQTTADKSLAFGLLDGLDMSKQAWKLVRPKHSVPKYGQ